MNDFIKETIKTASTIFYTGMIVGTITALATISVSLVLGLISLGIIGGCCVLLWLTIEKNWPI